MRRRIIIAGIAIIFMGIVASVLFAGTLLSSPYHCSIALPATGLQVEKVAIASRSGSNLSGWFLSGENDKGGILLMHGVRSNRLQMYRRAQFLHANGYSVLLFDFQGHGESRGEKITFGFLESKDAEAAFSFLEEKLKNKSIGVIGVSLGGAAALLGDVVERADALVLEAVYPTIEEAIENRLALRLGRLELLGRVLLPLLTVQMNSRLGFGPVDLRPIDHINRARGAVFILCGTVDRHTTVDESKRLYDQAQEPKKLWMIDGASHVDFSRFTPERYEEQIMTFFGKHLK